MRVRTLSARLVRMIGTVPGIFGSIEAVSMEVFNLFVLCANHVRATTERDFRFLLGEDRLNAVELNTCDFPGRR